MTTLKEAREINVTLTNLTNITLMANFDNMKEIKEIDEDFGMQYLLKTGEVRPCVRPLTTRTVCYLLKEEGKVINGHVIHRYLEHEQIKLKLEKLYEGNGTDPEAGNIVPETGLDFFLEFSHGKSPWTKYHHTEGYCNFVTKIDDLTIGSWETRLDIEEKHIIWHEERKLCMWLEAGNHRQPIYSKDRGNRHTESLDIYIARGTYEPVRGSYVVWKESPMSEKLIPSASKRIQYVGLDEKP